MEARNEVNRSDRPGGSIRSMIDEMKRLNERTRKSAAGTKFMTDLISYITAESKRHSDSGANIDYPRRSESSK